MRTSLNYMWGIFTVRSFRCHAGKLLKKVVSIAEFSVMISNPIARSINPDGPVGLARLSLLISTCI